MTESEMLAAASAAPVMTPAQGYWMISVLVLAVVLGWLWLEGWHE